MAHNRTTLFSTKMKHNLTRSTHLTNTSNITAALIGAVIAVNAPSSASANPVGADIKHGTVTIDAVGSKLNINQSSDKAIINWTDFSIGAAEHTEFKQPDANSIALNRVVGDNISNIQGMLTANGKVILVNPNGVLFDAGSVVDVHSLIATTADIQDQDFIDGNYNFSIKSPEGASVINKSASMSIKEGGVAAFVAPVVRNDGVILASASKVSLAGADSFTIDLYGDGLVNLEVQSEVKENAGIVENNGEIFNPQGTVALTTAEAQTIVNGVVNMGSIKQASSAHIVGDSIILDAGNSGSVEVDGDLVASGVLNEATDGGAIVVKGGQVDIKQTALLDASGAPAGNGGSVLVNSENTSTTFNGLIDVRPGEISGTGGAVEISGKEFYLAGSIEGGVGGTVTIDPTELYIGDGNGGAVPAANTVYEEWIESQSANGTNVVLTASELIQMEDLADGELSGEEGSISLLANQGGSTTGAIRFVDTTDAIKTTKGDIILEAGSGGIDVGDLLIDGDSAQPGTLRVSTTNNGAISARDLLVQGDTNASAEIFSDNAVSIRNLTVYAEGTNTDVTSTAMVSANNGSVEISNLIVGSFAGESADNDTAPTATATADITASGDVQLLNDTTVAAFVAALEQKDGDALMDTSTNATLNVNAGQNVTTQDVTVQSGLVATGNIYKSATATANATISAGDTVTTNGETVVSALSFLQSGDYASLSDVTANANLVISGNNGVTTNDLLGVYSGATANGDFAHNLSTNSKATLSSANGDIAVNGPVLIDADSSGAGAVPIDVVVEFLNHNAEYRNSFGSYNWEDKTGEIRWTDLSNATPGDTFTLRVADLEQNGFFLIPDGVNRNKSTPYNENDTVTFKLNENGKWAAYLGDKELRGADGGPVYFSSILGATGAKNDAVDGIFNPDGADHAITTEAVGNSNWEDKFTGHLGSEYKGDDNFDITYTEGDKANVDSSATLEVIATYGDIAINDNVATIATADIRGNGYGNVALSANNTFEAGESLTINGDVAAQSEVSSESNADDIETVVADAGIYMTAEGKTGVGNIAINGDIAAHAFTTKSADAAQAIIQVNAADNISFGDGITDPTASTNTATETLVMVQGRTTMQQTADNDASQLIFNAQLDPQPTDGGNNGGETPGGGDTGGETPGGETPGGDNGGTPPVDNPGDGNTDGETPGGDSGGTPSVEDNALNPIFIDPLQRFLISLRDAGLIEFVGQRPYTLSLSELNLSLLGSNGNTANLSPEQLGSLAPAAGGMAAGDTTINCANSYLDNGYGADASTANCGNNQTVN